MGIWISVESSPVPSVPESVWAQKGLRASVTMALTRDEKIALLEPELQSLLDARKVEPDVQALLHDAGVDSQSMLAAIAITRDELKNFAKDSLNLDASVRPGDVVKFASFFLAWQSATNRVKVQDELNSGLWLHRNSQSLYLLWRCRLSRCSSKGTTTS